jgi:hypothetical protein
MVTGQQLWQADALWPGILIAQCLRDVVPELREVVHMDDLEAKTSGLRQYPGALVMLDAIRPAQGTGGQVLGVSNLVQDWLVVLGVRRGVREVNRAQTEVAQLLPKVVRSLHGWKPAGQQRPLTWQPNVRPNYAADASWWPLTFSIQVVTA